MFDDGYVIGDYLFVVDFVLVDYIVGNGLWYEWFVGWGVEVVVLCMLFGVCY